MRGNGIVPRSVCQARWLQPDLGPAFVPNDRRLVSASRSSRLVSALRVSFGVVLFAGWVAETIIWVASTIHLANAGETMAVVSAVVALLLLALLAGMEGLEVAVIDHWRTVFIGGSTSELARWLSARQLFVALTVTSATLLARRSVIVVPFTSARVTAGVPASVFDLTWIGFTVLWFGQIVPKALAATNSVGYLQLLRRPLFPLVAVVRAVGVTQPGEWVASTASRMMGWTRKTPEEIVAEAAAAQAWSALTPEDGPASEDKRG